MMTASIEEGFPVETASKSIEPEQAIAASHAPLQVGGVSIHRMLVTVPVGAFICVLAFDLASVVSEGYVYARGAMWLVVLGLAAALVAAIVGVIDARRRIKPGSPQQRRAGRHVLANAAVILVFVIGLAIRRSSLDQLVDGTPVSAIVLSVVGVGLLLCSVWMGSALSTDLDRSAIRAGLPVAPDEPTRQVVDEEDVASSS